MVSQRIVRNVNFDFICDRSNKKLTVPITRGLALKVLDRRKISKVLERLPPIADNVTHLKRVNGSLVLVGFFSEELRERICALYTDCEFGTELVEVDMPLAHPVTRVQFNFCQAIWPVHFREDPDLERKIADRHFEPGIRVTVKALLNEASTSGDSIIVEPSTMNIIARASDSESDPEDPLKHPFIRCLEAFSRRKGTKRKRSTSADQYLCNDCYIFLTHEPCAMCAMALVHARVKTVFFSKTSTNGAFVTNCQLHLNCKLNHHYEVYHVRPQE